MANVNMPRGLVPIGHLMGETDFPFNIYYVTDATALFQGDPVKSAGSADPTGRYPTISQAAAGDPIRGVVVGFGKSPQQMVDPTNLMRTYRLANEALYVAVIDDPFVVFEIQENSSPAALAATDVGSNADIIVAAGNTANGLSGIMLDCNALSNSGSAQLRILCLANRDDNAIGAYAKWEVLINEHELKLTNGA